MMRGVLKLIIGNMFAHKAGRPMHEVETLREIGEKKILVLNPDIDTRSGKGLLKDYRDRAMEAQEVSVSLPVAIFSVLRSKEAEAGSRFHLIAFDEVQFSPADSAFFRVVDDLRNLGYDVLAAGLALDFKREPFGCTLQLVGLCRSGQDCVWLSPLCARCGKPAPMPQRVIRGKPAHFHSPRAQVGGKETYEPRCFECHDLPGRPIVMC